MTSPPRLSPCRVGVLGAGTIGSSFLTLLARRSGFEVTGVLVRDPGKPRSIPEPLRRFRTDPEEVLGEADLVVELMGGTGLAGDLMLRSLGAGKRVVTANKAALAERWDAFLPALREGRLYFEAAVMAGTPVIGPLTGALRGSRPLELHAILNGTCNFILNQLEQGGSYREALAEAQRLGFAEPDPSLDVEGFDAAHKLCLLGKLGFDPDLSWRELAETTHGISHLTSAIVREAMEDGGRVRLLGSVFPRNGRWEARVRPVYLPADHPMAAAESSRNVLLFRGDAVGEVFVTGPGAGALPTASAVLADLLAAAAGRPGPQPLEEAQPLPEDYQPEDLGELLKA